MSLYCFINTNEDWELVKKKYKNEKKIICSTSPEILLNNSIKEKKVVLDANNQRKQIKFIKNLSFFYSSLFNKIRRSNFSYNFAVYYISFISRFSKLLNFAICTEKDFKKKRIVVIKSITQDSEIKNVINFPYEKVLEKNNNIKINNNKIIRNKFNFFLKSPNLFIRTIYNGLHNFEFLIWRLIWKVWPNSLTKGLVLIAIDGPLLRETAVHLSRAGYKFINIPRKIIIKKKKHILDNHKKTNKINKFFKDFLRKNFSKNLSNQLYDIFLKESNEFIKRYNFSRLSWQNYFKENLQKANKVKCLLSTHLNRESYAGLSDYLIKKKINIYNFQHGHSREIRVQNYQDKWFHIYEPLADTTFTYSKVSQKVSNKINKFKRGKYLSAGIPSNLKKKKIIFFNPKHEILYLSTTLCMGFNYELLSLKKISDKRKTEIELKIINNVLKKVPYKVLYKFYPIKGNLTESLIKSSTERSKNISLVKKNFDSKYLFNTKRVIIVSNANSTFGGALLSNLPLIYIDTHQMKLKSNVLKLIKKSTFYFDFNDKDFFYDLKKFLSKPLDKIYKIYKKKEKIRERLISEFFKDTLIENSGKFSAKQILNNF